jgi:hypothetical protein
MGVRNLPGDAVKRDRKPRTYALGGELAADVGQGALLLVVQ